MLHPRLLLLMIMSLSLCALSGCATILGNSKKTINVTSDPSGAMVELNGNQIGETPLTYRVPDRDMSHPGILTIKKDGFEPATTQVTSRFQMIAILNFTFLWHWAIDYVFGNLYTLEKTKFDVKLELNRRPGS